MKQMSADSKAVMETIQKGLQFGSFLLLALVGWIARDALVRLERLDERLSAIERSDAVQNFRLSHLEPGQR